MTRRSRLKAYVGFVLLAEAVGALSGWLTRNGMEQYSRTVQKPPLTPPDAVFPIVWGILFLLMGIGAARVYLSGGPGTRRALLLFTAQLAFNFVWSILFFNLQAFGVAFFWLILLWVLIFIMTLAFCRVDRPAAWMQIPYLLWVAFAGYLNCAVWMLNR